LTACWSLASEASLALRRWDDEYVVHHAQSNDTHRISGTAGRILQMLSEAGMLDIDGLVRDGELDAVEVHETLLALAELDLVTQC
jgi:PqqD family protein of HPr-rel-A system